MLQVGAPAPPFRLESDTGETVSLADLRGSRVVLYFYPRDNTSGCTTEAREFQDLLGAFEALGVRVIGVSRDSLRSHARFREKLGLTFPLLSDPDHRVMAAYGAWGEKRARGKVAEGPIRTTVVIGPDGTVERVYPKVRARGHAAQVLRDLGAGG